MKYIHLLIIVLLFSCSNKTTQDPSQTDIEKDNKIHTEAFQTLLDSNAVEGSIIVYHLESDRFFSNDFVWAEKLRLPASTFKITNSIIGLESDSLLSDTSMFIWDGKPRRMAVWEKDLNLKQAFQASCVPCYQELARKTGVEKMRQMLDTLNYGNMVFDSSTIDLFWLEGESGISCLEQIDFLKRLYLKQLPISSKTSNTIKHIMLLDSNGTYTLYGKTGWAIRNGQNNGWFVGFTESKLGTLIFATNVNPKEEFQMELFPKIRYTLSEEALHYTYTNFLDHE